MAEKLFESLGRELRYVEYKIRQHHAKHKREKERRHSARRCSDEPSSHSSSSNPHCHRPSKGSHHELPPKTAEPEQSHLRKNKEMERPSNSAQTTDPWGAHCAAKADFNVGAEMKIEIRKPSQPDLNKDHVDLLCLDFVTSPEVPRVSVNKEWNTFRSSFAASNPPALSDLDSEFDSIATKSVAASAPGNLENPFDVFSCEVGQPPALSENVLLPENVFRTSTASPPRNSFADSFLGGNADLVNFANLIENNQSSPTPREMFSPKPVALSMNSMRGAFQQVSLTSSAPNSRRSSPSSMHSPQPASPHPSTDAPPDCNNAFSMNSTSLPQTSASPVSQGGSPVQDLQNLLM